jgi:hypothetical protein
MWRAPGESAGELAVWVRRFSTHSTASLPEIVTVMLVGELGACLARLASDSCATR